MRENALKNCVLNKCLKMKIAYKTTKLTDYIECYNSPVGIFFIPKLFDYIMED